MTETGDLNNKDEGLIGNGGEIGDLAVDQFRDAETTMETQRGGDPPMDSTVAVPASLPPNQGDGAGESSLRPTGAAPPAARSSLISCSFSSHQVPLLQHRGCG